MPAVSLTVESALATGTGGRGIVAAGDIICDSADGHNSLFCQPAEARVFVFLDAHDPAAGPGRANAAWRCRYATG